MKKYIQICIIVLFTMLVLNVNTIKVYANTTKNTSTITVNVKDADIRDVLSIIALNMNYNVIYAGESTRITIDMQNVKPIDAFNYVLKLTGLSYVKDGTSLIVAPKETLVEDFTKSLSITSFKLNYISSQILTEKIQEINIPVTVLLMPSNNNTLWVQGLPSDIAKVSELIRILDIAENYNLNTQIYDDTKLLQTITMSNITAIEFNEFIYGLGFTSGIAFGNNDMTLWIYATLEENDELWAIKNLVDQPNSSLSASSSNIYENIYIRYASKDLVINAITTAYPNVTAYNLENATNNFLIMGTQADVHGAKKLAEKIDSVNVHSLQDTVFAYQLQNLSAAEIERRLENITFASDVTWYTTADSELSTTIYIYANSDYINEVIDLVKKIDESAISEINKINMPVFRAQSVEELNTVKSYLEIMVSSSNLIGVFETTVFDGQYVLYLKDTTPQTVKLVEEVLAKIRGTDQSSDIVDVSWDTYIATFPDVDKSDMALYGLWVKMRLEGA